MVPVSLLVFQLLEVCPLLPSFLSLPPLTHTVTCHPGMSGVFSPLDAATPASLPAPPSGVGATEVGGQWWQQQGQQQQGGPHSVTPSAATPSAATPALAPVNMVRPPTDTPQHSNHRATGTFGVHSCDCKRFAISEQSYGAQSTITVTAATSLQASHQLAPESSGSSSLHHRPHSPDTHFRAEAGDSVVDGPGTAPPPLEPPSTQTNSQALTHPLPVVARPSDDDDGSSVHLQYFEKLIRDSNEELRCIYTQSCTHFHRVLELLFRERVFLSRYATHRDIRALGVDMFRQFLMLQVKLLYVCANFYKEFLHSECVATSW